jgi:coenzyme PQQ precursor peptide PqqA
MAGGLSRPARQPQHAAWEFPLPAARTHPPCRIHRPPRGDPLMQWQTPSATDLRFGFEITLYVAAR